MIVLFGSQLAGQENIIGRILDLTGEPLPYAMVLALDTTHKRTLGYVTADAKGDFQLSVGNSIPIILVTRYLGKLPDSMLLRPPWPDVVNVRLKEGADLPEIRVVSERPPVTERGDTTTYDLADFSDSTDNKIEDVLRKLPGVEVMEDGSIEVNGKSIQTILIEGTDLFGMDYQLASKNIRAADIGTVETIDHYQEDAVMRTVNFSDEVVLNLKLRPDKRSIISGELLGAAGAGKGGGRYQLYAPLYRISRKHKTFGIINTDNVAADSGFGNDAALTINGSDALRTPLFSAKRYYAEPTVRRLGLPRAFTDNTQTLAGQIRHDYSEEAHAIFARVSGLRRQADQRTRSREIFVGNSSVYMLNNRTEWQRRMEDIEGELEYRFSAPDQRTSLRVYAQSGRNDMSVDQSFSSEATVLDTTLINNKPLLLRTVAARQLSNRAVARFEVAHQQVRRRERSLFTSSDLNTLVGDAADGLLRQYIAAQQTKSSVTARWLSQLSPHLKVDVSTALQRYEHAISSKLNDRSYIDTLRLIDIVPAVNMIYKKGKWLHRLQSNYHFNQRGLNRAQLKWSGLTVLTKGRELEFSASRSNALPNSVALLNDVVYASDPFAATQTTRLNTLTQRLGVYGIMRWQNDSKLARTRISLSADRSHNDIINEFIFADRAILRRPLAAPVQYSTNVSIYRSFFSLPLKSDVRLTADLSYRNGVYRTNEQFVDFKTLTYNASAQTSWRLSRVLRLKGRFWLRFADGLSGINLGLFTGRVSSELIATYKRLRIYVAGFAVDNRSGTGRSTLWNTYIGGRYTLSTSRTQNLSVFLRVYNPLNRPTLERRDVSDLFERTDTVETVGGFGYLGCSFGL